MKKIVSLSAILIFTATIIIFGQSPYLDEDFGTGGKVITNPGYQGSRGNSVLIQPDGKILMAGYTYIIGESDFALMRYNTDGTMDNSFSQDGKVFTDFESAYEYARSLAIQQDGKIIVAGNSNTFFALARYNPDGAIDSSFGQYGKVTTDFADEGYYKCGPLTILPDGKILLAGSLGETGALVRYKPDGTPDSTFCEDGKLEVDFGDTNDEYLSVSMAVQQDGKIVVSGFSSGFDCDFTVLRYKPDGSLDSLFGTDGKVTTDIYNSTDDRSRALTIQQDGKILVTGWSGLQSDGRNDWDFGVARYNTDGTPDASFGQDGKVITDLKGLWDDRPEAIAVQSDGKILVAGYTYNIGESDFALMRYNTDGSPDSTINGSGLITTDFNNSSNDQGLSLAVQPDGKIIVAGFSDDNIAIVRYLPDIALRAIDLSDDGNPILVYPVPVANEAILKYSLYRDEILSISLYDNTGNKVQSFIDKEKRAAGVHTEAVNVNPLLSPGGYILELRTPSKRVYMKIIKN